MIGVKVGWDLGSGRLGKSGPPFSMPLTAASEMVRSAFLMASFAASTADFWVRVVVEKARGARRVVVRKNKDIFEEMVVFIWEDLVGFWV